MYIPDNVAESMVYDLQYMMTGAARISNAGYTSVHRV